MPEVDLRQRTKQFALAVITFTRGLGVDPARRTIGGQLLRSATSVAANYRAACRARSKKEFLAKLGLVEEEADESALWLELLVDSDLVDPALATELLQEANELTAIMVASIRTSRAVAGRSQLRIPHSHFRTG